MPKDTNGTTRFTISAASTSTLKSIQAEISQELGITLTLAQTVERLIYQYEQAATRKLDAIANEALKGVAKP